MLACIHAGKGWVWFVQGIFVTCLVQHTLSYLFLFLRVTPQAKKLTIPVVCFGSSLKASSRNAQCEILVAQLSFTFCAARCSFRYFCFYLWACVWICDLCRCKVCSPQSLWQRNSTFVPWQSGMEATWGAGCPAYPWWWGPPGPWACYRPSWGARAPQSEVKDTPPFAAFSTPHPPGTRHFEDALGVDGQRDRQPHRDPPQDAPTCLCERSPAEPCCRRRPQACLPPAPCFMPPQPRPSGFSCASAAPSLPRGAGRERESCLGYETRRAAWPRSSHRAALG